MSNPYKPLNEPQGTDTERVKRRGICKMICQIFLGIIMILAVVMSLILYIVYGGIWWGRLNHGCDIIGEGRVMQIWQITLSMWVLGLIVPLLAPFLCSCFLVAWTTPSGCQRFRNEVEAFYKSPAGEDPQFQDWYMKWTEAGGRFSSQKLCEEGNVAMIWAVILGGIVLMYIIVRQTWRARKEHRQGQKDKEPRQGEKGKREAPKEVEMEP